MDNRVVQLQSLEIERRKAAAIATKDFNRSMVSERNLTALNAAIGFNKHFLFPPYYSCVSMGKG